MAGGTSGTVGAGGARAALEAVHPSWAAALEPALADLERALERGERERAGGAVVLPAADRVLRAFTTPLDDVRVLLLGQDPYPTPGHAVGLAFSVEPTVRPLPPTLRNVLRELVADTGVPTPPTGDLSPWADRGVLLLNRVLTVRAGESGSHRRSGWEAVTDHAVRALAARGGPLVSVLWGRDAQAVAPLLAGTAVVTGVHPSPLSASRGFTGSRPFSAVDALLAEQGAPPVDWTLA